jgi:hypothetical protein
MRISGCTPDIVVPKIVVKNPLASAGDRTLPVCLVQIPSKHFFQTPSNCVIPLTRETKFHSRNKRIDKITGLYNSAFNVFGSRWKDKALLLLIRKVSESNLDRETGYPDSFLGFTQYIQANAEIVP